MIVYIFMFRKTILRACPAEKPDNEEEQAWFKNQEIRVTGSTPVNRGE
jgi:hypothetical protein